MRRDAAGQVDRVRSQLREQETQALEAMAAAQSAAASRAGLQAQIRLLQSQLREAQGQVEAGKVQVHQAMAQIHRALRPPGTGWTERAVSAAHDIASSPARFPFAAPVAASPPGRR